MTSLRRCILLNVPVFRVGVSGVWSVYNQVCLFHFIPKSLFVQNFNNPSCYRSQIQGKRLRRTFRLNTSNNREFATHSFKPFLQRLFKSATTPKSSRHSTDTVSQ